MLPFLFIGFDDVVAQSKEYNPFSAINEVKLKEDLIILRNGLEQVHPSLYWFASKGHMDSLFDRVVASAIKPQSEFDFENKISEILSEIRCGHTTVTSSKKASEYYKKHYRSVFPFGVTPVNDTLVIGPYQTNGIQRGAKVLAIDGYSSFLIMDSLRKFVSGDGFNNGFKDGIIRRSFGPYYRDVFGEKDSFILTLLDTGNLLTQKTVKAYHPKNIKPKPISKTEKPQPKKPALSKRQQAAKTAIAMRNLRVDTANSLAIMSLRTFRNYGHRRFFRKSFKLMKKQKTSNLVLDLRDNGGGLIINSALLLKYLKFKKFSYCDSAYGITKKLPKNNFRIKYYEKLTVKFLSRKRKDGLYHSAYLDQKKFRIKRRKHFDGQVYVITNGYTFSAASITTAHLKGQHNVKIVGEETGGGGYGNSAVIMAILTLPNSKLQVRIPMYRMVLKYNLSEFGKGVLPDINIGVTSASIKEGKDLKLEKIYNLIKESKKLKK